MHDPSQEKVEILDYYYNVGQQNKKGTARWVAKKFKRPSFTANSLRRILSSEKKIRKGVKKVRLNVGNSRSAL